MQSLSGYDMYMQRGPMPSTDSASNIELSRLDYNRTTDNLPLLNNNSPPLGGPNNNTYPPQQQQQRLDAPALTRYMTGDSTSDWDQRLQPAPPQLYLPDHYRDAPTHRPYTPSRDPSTDSVNMAGRGARRGAY